jgi:hypothetical protein
MRPYAPVIGAIALLVMHVLLAGCGGGRDLSSPARRLVGHWTDRAGDQVYFGLIPDGKSTGPYTLVQPDGNTAHHRYSIVSENPRATQVVVHFLFNEGSSRTDIYHVSARGDSAAEEVTLFGYTVTSVLWYVDGKQQP